MAPLIPIALSLAKEFLPSLVGKIAGDTTGGVAKRVLDAAGDLVGVQVDGDTTGQMVASAIKQSPELALKFQQRMAELEMEVTEAFLADRQSARDRDATIVKAGRMNVRADLMVAFSFIAIIVISVFLILADKVDPGVLAFLTTIGGMMVKNLSTAFDFEFGSSRSSKGKSEDMGSLMKQLAGGKG